MLRNDKSDVKRKKLRKISKKGENIKKLKVCLTISSGSTINPSLSVGYQDFSDPKVYKVTSPGGTIEKEWTIMIFETR